MYAPALVAYISRCVIYFVRSVGVIVSANFASDDHVNGRGFVYDFLIATRTAF